MFLAWLTSLVMVLRSSVSEWPQCGGWGPGSRSLVAGPPGNECAEVATGDQITETSGNILTGEFSRDSGTWRQKPRRD